MTDKKAPMVRVGDNWVPAHRVWNVVEAMNTAADLVAKFNEKRPELSTEMTRDVVDKARERIRSMDLALGGSGSLKEAAVAAGVADADAPDLYAGDNTAGDAASQTHGSTEIDAPNKPRERRLANDDYAEAAKQLLGAMSVDEALRMLKNDYDNPVDMVSLVELVGEKTYHDTLLREAKEFVANMIAPDQVAELWNESKYPPPSGNLWTEQAVQDLLKDA